MSLHPVLLEKLNEALHPGPRRLATRRDAVLPPVPGKVHAVIGMRRAGKSTFLRQLQAQWRLETEAARAVYFSFDDDRLADLPLEQLGHLVEEYYRRHPRWRGTTKVWWLLDEIQLVPGWERFVRRLLDSEEVGIVVSGSSAKMLSREVHTSLRGRGIETIIRPFSFREFLRHRNEEPVEPARALTSAGRSRLEKCFGEYLAVGGFPEAQGLDAGLGSDLLQGYVDSVLFRDVVERHGVTQVAALRWLIRQCLRNPGGSFSVHRLHLDLKAQGLGINKDTLHEVMGHVEDAFLVRGVLLATESERRRNSNPRKVYPVDTGLIRAFDRSGRSNLGHALETVVLHELDRQRAEVGYVRTADGCEVDFLAHYPDGRRELIQVCADLDAPGTRERELRAMAQALLEHPGAACRILTLHAETNPPPAGITIEPAYRWLLEEN